jgi:hypothetical protein
MPTQKPGQDALVCLGCFHSQLLSRAYQFQCTTVRCCPGKIKSQDILGLHSAPVTCMSPQSSVTDFSRLREASRVLTPRIGSMSSPSFSRPFPSEPGFVRTTSILQSLQHRTSSGSLESYQIVMSSNAPGYGVTLGAHEGSKGSRLKCS